MESMNEHFRGPDRNQQSWFNFIDLFAGIGGFRLGFESVGGHCVLTSEWDAYARKTYAANFLQDESSQHPFAGDIRELSAEEIPPFDVLLAGFPCQPFSIAGVTKKNALGRPHGFACEAQGTLFFEIARIIKACRPAAFVLENVKNLASHDRGNTIRVIRDVLKNELGYELHERIINARHFVPQHRERIFLVGFREPTKFSFERDFTLPNRTPIVGEILHPEDGSEPAEPPFTNGPKGLVDPKYTLTPKLWAYLQSYAEKHRQKGNGFGFGLVRPGNVTRTLSARYYKDGSEILVWQQGKPPRRLTPRECSRLMGFDTPNRRFVIPVSDTRAYKQFGNAVVVPVAKAVAQAIAPHLRLLLGAQVREIKR
jgi:DNA (cytosine-5)-methyltransferase 1